MAKTDFTKRYKKKIATKVVMAVGALVILSLVIISYLGTLSGNYTITLTRDNRNLSIADNLGFVGATTRLNAEKLHDVAQCTLDEMPSDEELDKDDSKSHNGMTGFDKGGYLAYTFYLKNVGDVLVNYSVSLNIEGMNLINSDDPSKSLDETLRVMIYENDVNFDESNQPVSEHNKKLYAKKANTIRGILTGEGQEIIDERECATSYSEDYKVCTGDRFPERAIPFEEGAQIINYMSSISPNQIRRYSVVMWLEGEDPDGEGEPPVGSGLVLSMDLTGVNN